MVKMNWSKKFMDKFFVSFSPSKKKWYKTLYWYATDYRHTNIKIRLDRFLANQLEKPTQRLYDLANDFKTRFRDKDKRIVAILKWVNDNIIYEEDRTNFDTPEYWASAIETLELGRDDCDGINALIYILARLSGIPSIQLFSVIGDTSVGGHFWLIYFSTKTLKWHTIDGTYYPDFTPINRRKEFNINNTRYKKIWFIFNDQYIYKTK